MTAPPAPLDDTVTWQTPADGVPSVHMAGTVTEVFAVPEVCESVTVPVGLYPVTVAVQVLDEPTTTVEGAQPTVKLDVA